MKNSELGTVVVVRCVGAVVLASLVSAQSSLTGTWTGVQILEPTMVSSSPPEAPVVACDAAGHAVSVWTSPSKGVTFTERYPGGTWSAADSIVPGVVGDFPQVAIGPSGVVAASWSIPGQQYVPPKFVVSVRPVGGAFPPPTVLVSGLNVFDARLGVAADGSVTVVWGAANGIQAAMRTPAGVWSAPLTLSSNGVGPNLPDLVVNGAGAALAVWQETPAGGTGPSEIGAAYRPAPSGSAWGAAQVISAGTGQPTWNPKPGIDAAGDVAVGYLDGSTMMLATKPAAASWGVPVPVSPPTDNVYYPALAMDAAGNILTAWQKLVAATNQGKISKRIIPASGPWGTVTALSTNAQDATWPMASIASNGSVWAVTWGDNNTFATKAAIGDLSGAWNVHGIGSVWWNTVVPVAAGSGAVSAVWPAPTNNANVTNMVANVYTSSSSSYCTAGTTSSGCNASITGTGSASASAGSGYTLTVSSVEGQQSGIIFYGTNNSGFTPGHWGLGTSFMCVKSPLERSGIQSSGGTSGACDGVLALDWNLYIATHPLAIGNPFAAGQVVFAQGWFRDPPAPKTTSLSNGLQFTVNP